MHEKRNLNSGKLSSFSLHAKLNYMYRRRDEEKKERARKERERENEKGRKKMRAKVEQVALEIKTGGRKGVMKGEISSKGRNSKYPTETRQT